MRFFLSRFFIVVMLLLPLMAGAKVSLQEYGLAPIPDSLMPQMQQRAQFMADSLLAKHPMLANKKIVYSILQHRPFVDNTTGFYLLLSLCLLLGLIRLSDPKYFFSLWRAFWNPTLSNRQLKDQLQGAGISSLIMNIFFTVVAGAYIFYIIKIFAPTYLERMSPGMLILVLVSAVMLIYMAKYATIRFTGWAFKVEGVTDHYIFNIFLINKILAIALIPFIIVMAFGNPVWAEPLAIVSFFVTGLLFANRYVRSWQVFGSFFQYSKFHFFTYLCASEILPMAVLMKVLVRLLLQF